MHSENSQGSIQSGELVVSAALKMRKQYISINSTWSDYQYRCHNMVPDGRSLGYSVLLTAGDSGVKISYV